jgi:GT2 family glycosyltransferase
MSGMRVFTVIPTYNRKRMLARCLYWLSRQTFSTIVYVGDAGSTDGTWDMLALEYPDVVVCRGDSNLWWTGAINLALRRTLGICNPNDRILCLNDDTEVDADYIERLLEAAGKKEKRIVGSVSVDIRKPDTIVDGGNQMNWITAAFRSFNAGRKLTEFPIGYEQQVNVLSGRGTLIPAQAFFELGLFAEEQLPHYGADYEFSVRCARASYELLISYGAVIKSNTNSTGMHHVRNRLSLNELSTFIFGRRSSCNIRDRFYLAWLTRCGISQSLIYFVMSLIRIFCHYLGAKPAKADVL